MKLTESEQMYIWLTFEVDLIQGGHHREQTLANTKINNKLVNLEPKSAEKNMRSLR